MVRREGAAADDPKRSHRNRVSVAMLIAVCTLVACVAYHGLRKPTETPTFGQPMRVSDRLSFEPINVRFVPNTAAGDLPGRPAGGWSVTGFEELLPLTTEVDVAWNRHSLFLLERSGACREVKVDPSDLNCDVAGDGRHIFVAATGRTGVRVYDEQGALLAELNERSGIPPMDVGGVAMHVVEPGLVLLAAQTVPQKNRTWVGLIDVRGDKPTARCLVDADIAVDPTKSRYEQSRNPRLAFRVECPIVEHVGATGRRLFYVLRVPTPIVIDRTTWSVDVYPARDIFDNTFPARPVNKAQVASHGGILYVADGWDDYGTFARDESTGRFRPIALPQDWGGGQSCSLALRDGWLYYCGVNPWFRHNLASGERQVLSDNRALFRQEMYGAWRLVNSKVFGLVAVDHRQICRVLIDGEPVP